MWWWDSQKYLPASAEERKKKETGETEFTAFILSQIVSKMSLSFCFVFCLRSLMLLWDAVIIIHRKLHEIVFKFSYNIYDYGEAIVSRMHWNMFVYVKILGYDHTIIAYKPVPQIQEQNRLLTQIVSFKSMRISLYVDYLDTMAIKCDIFTLIL